MNKLFISVACNKPLRSHQSLTKESEEGKRPTRKQDEILFGDLRYVALLPHTNRTRQFIQRLPLCVAEKQK